jgi:hypothetical protein
MPQTFQPLTPYNPQNHESLQRTLWTRVHLEINESKAKSDDWGVKIIHKEAKGTHPWSPQRNLERNTLKLTNRVTNKNPKNRLHKSLKNRLEERIWHGIAKEYFTMNNLAKSGKKPLKRITNFGWQKAQTKRHTHLSPSLPKSTPKWKSTPTTCQRVGRNSATPIYIGPYTRREHH